MRFYRCVIILMQYQLCFFISGSGPAVGTEAGSPRGPGLRVWRQRPSLKAETLSWYPSLKVVWSVKAEALSWYCNTALHGVIMPRGNLKPSLKVKTLSRYCMVEQCHVVILRVILRCAASEYTLQCVATSWHHARFAFTRYCIVIYLIVFSVL